MNNPSRLDILESQSIYIIREAYWRYKGGLALLWSMGKDSTAMVHLARKAFLGDPPISVVHIDTGYKFKEIYAFRDRYAKEWNLNLSVVKNQDAMSRGVSCEGDRFSCCTALKTEALAQAINLYHWQALLVAIRRDEHTIRAKERYFSSRDKDSRWDYQHQGVELWGEYFRTQLQPGTHARVHPLLGWRELDVWEYVLREKLPVVSLYLAKHKQRYRSIGCECCCQTVSSAADTVAKIVKELRVTRLAERSGRVQDKEREYMMQKLRSLGYM